MTLTETLLIGRGGGSNDCRGFGWTRVGAGGDGVGSIFFVDNGACLRRLAGFGDDIPTTIDCFDAIATDIDDASSGPKQKDY